MATVTDSPLDKKVEMTHWEKVRGSIYSYLGIGAHCAVRKTGANV